MQLKKIQKLLDNKFVQVIIWYDVWYLYYLFFWVYLYLF